VVPDDITPVEAANLARLFAVNAAHNCAGRPISEIDLRLEVSALELSRLFVAPDNKDAPEQP
jgi:hypothetical protein